MIEDEDLTETYDLITLDTYDDDYIVEIHKFDSFTERKAFRQGFEFAIAEYNRNGMYHIHVLDMELLDDLDKYAEYVRPLQQHHRPDLEKIRKLVEWKPKDHE